MAAAPPKHPRRSAQLPNPELRKRAQGAAKRLRELPESPDVPGGRMLEPATCEWIAELLDALARRIPVPQQQRAPARRR